MIERVVCVSGGFDPIRKGHLSHLREAKKLGDRLVVILNPDSDLIRKKGYCFQTYEEREAIISDLRYVDSVIRAIDGDGTVAKTLELIRPSIFAKGGDRTPDNIVSNEVDVCRKINCKIVYGIGEPKTDSSQEVVRRLVRKILSIHTGTRPNPGHRGGWPKGRKHSTEHNQRISLAQKGKPKSAEHCKAISQGKVGKHLSSKTREKLSITLRGKPNLLNRIKLLGNRNRVGKLASSETSRKLSLAHKGKHVHSEEWKQTLRARMREGQAARMSIQARYKPTKPERQMIEILKNSSLPFLYNGGINNGWSSGIIVARMAPDFVDIENKRVIELYGDYWHRGEDETIKILRYKNAGWDCLVVWEREIQDESKLVPKLRRWYNERY